MKKYLKYIIMFTLTAIISLLLIFYNPDKKMLGVYKDKITIEYDITNCTWDYILKNDTIKLDSHLQDDTKEKWIFNYVKDGDEFLEFECKKDEDIIYTIKYTFKVTNNKIKWIEGEGIGMYDFPNPY